MQYCSIEEAWGNPSFKKKKKKKKLYKSNIPQYIEDTSYLEGGHDNYCVESLENNVSKNKFNHSRNNKNIYNKKKTRSPKVQISYDNAAQEYRNFQLENSHIKQQDNKEELLVEGFESGDELNTIEELEKTFNDVDEVEYTNTETEDLYNPSKNYSPSNNYSETELDTDDELEKEINEIIDDEKKNKKANTNGNNTNGNNTNGNNTNGNNVNINSNKELDINDIDYRLNNLNRNVNTLLKKMDESDFFDDDSQDNIHDLILFILFGVFMIFVLDTVHKLGKN